MKKIIIISESKQFTKIATDFVNQLKEQQPKFLVGCFAHSLNYAELIETSRQPYMRLVIDLVEQDREAVEDNVMLFEHFCSRERTNYRIHEENNRFKIEHLITESRFADLLIVNGRLFTKHSGPLSPEINLQQTLQKSECPILLLPEKFNSFKKIAIAYDGGKESMFALKQFTYLFPQLSTLPTEIVYLSEQEKYDVPAIKLLKEYVSNNLGTVSISKIHINPKKDLAKWAAIQQDVLVIAGSYGRTGMVNSVTDSFIDPILEMKQLSVFITHH
jgi:hypothetical protein